MSKPFPLTRRAVGVCSVAVLAASIAWAPLQAQAQSRKDTVILGMILEPIYQLFDACINDKKDKSEKMMSSLGIVLKTEEKELTGKALMKRVMQ